MKNISILTILLFISNLLYGQINVDYNIDCVQLSTVEYLIIVKNNANKSLFLPVNPIVQKCNDTLFINGVFSYQHHNSTVYKYKINGVSFDIDAPLNSYIKPDTVYQESVGYVPNFAVPSPLVELKPQNKYSYRIFNSTNQQPRTIAFSGFLKNSTDEQNKQVILGKIISVGVLKQ